MLEFILYLLGHRVLWLWHSVMIILGLVQSSPFQVLMTPVMCDQIALWSNKVQGAVTDLMSSMLKTCVHAASSWPRYLGIVSPGNHYSFVNRHW